MTGTDKRRIRKNSIRIKVGSLMFLAVLLLSVTFYLFYRNLSSIVASIKIDSTPELKLLNIREISSGIEQAGYSVRLYTLTKNLSDIRPYYRFVSGIDEKIGNLRKECGNDSTLLAQTDTIGNLIEQNIVIWNKLLALYKDDDVVENIRELSEKLNEAPAETPRQGILKRVFGKGPDTPPVEREIAADLDSIVYQSEIAREQMAAREVQLAANNREITNKFYDLITRMENEVNSHIRANAEEAAGIAGHTYRWLVLTAVSGGLLAILIIIIIIRYSRNAWAYQAALENSKNETIRLARTRELFMANMSHEIRTPVTAISGFTDLLLRESPDSRTAESLKIIKSSSDHLLRIIDDILDFSKLQNNKITLEKVHFSIGAVISDVYTMFENMARQNNTVLSCHLSPGTPPALIGDPYRLRQILINLISNAVKFTKNGSVHYEVTGNMKSPEEIELIIEVSDTGIGIDESRINAVFEDFTQAEMSTTRKYGGTGLGLSIVKKLVEIQKGTIDLTSRKNKGTTIVCRIPFLIGDEKQIKKEATRPLSVPEELKEIKILVADDEEYNRLLFKKIFERWNVSCDLAASGMDALEMLKENKYDLLFIDMLMPGIDGLKTTKFIREEMNISESEMPVILISAAPPGEDREKYKNAGISSFVLKPFTEEILLSSVLASTSRGTIPSCENQDAKANRQPSDIEKIDTGNLFHIAAGDNDFVKQMLESFLRATETGLEEMQEAAKNGEYESVAALSHKLQPPCRHLGAADLFNLLYKVEKAIKNNETVSLESEIKNILSEFAAVRKAVTDQISKIKEKA
jgi:signal transduction histidine kinase/DNA-binding NarL/FixJ family response regulator